jgi:mono/diheme cytochrome c family protein
MRHFIVRRTALLLGTVFIGCTVLFAWLVSPELVVPATPPIASDGARLFQAHCASCHTVESLRPSASGPADRRKDLERFLAAHGEASDAEDRLILDYLAANGAPPDRK